MKNLPKPQKDLPLPRLAASLAARQEAPAKRAEKDLPLPEKELSSPSQKSNSKTNIFKSKFFLGFILASGLIAFLIGEFVLGLNESKNQTVCTQEAKMCSDGSYVGRSGPNCEFAKCPSSPIPKIKEDNDSDTATKENWKTYVNEEENWQIGYPTNENFKIQTHESTQIGQDGIGKVVVFSKVGPTQSEGTEFYDGISVTIGLKQKSSAQTVMEFADKDSLPNPDIGTRTPLKGIAVNGNNGVETTVSSLGEARLVYLEYPVYTDRVYYMAIFSTGPGESEAKYDEIVEKMLQTFKSYR